MNISYYYFGANAKYVFEWSSKWSKHFEIFSGHGCDYFSYFGKVAGYRIWAPFGHNSPNDWAREFM